MVSVGRTKHVFRIPVAEDFIEPIGEAVCVSQYLDQVLFDIGGRLSAKFQSDNHRSTSGNLVKSLQTLINKVDLNAALRDELEVLLADVSAVFRARNMIVHSKGYTTDEGSQSRFYRGDPQSGINYLSPEDVKAFTKNAAKLAVIANQLLHDERMTD